MAFGTIITKHDLIIEVVNRLMEYDSNYKESWEIFDEYERDMAYKIVHEIADGVEHERWRLIPFGRLQRIWNEFSRFKFIRDEKGMEMIRNICIANTARLYVNSILVGRTSNYPKKYIEDEVGYCFKEKKEEPKEEPIDPNQLSLFNPEVHQIPKQEKQYDPCEGNTLDLTWDEFEDRMYTYIGDDTFSDYATKPLINLACELIEAKSPEEQLLICDRMFNVIHMRGDIAALFVQGGSNSLSKLSGEHAESQVYRPI